MESDIDAIRASVAAALRLLDRRLDRLAGEIAHCDGRFSVWGAASQQEAARRIADAYNAITLGTQEPANKSVVCLGIAAVPAHVVALAAAVNDAKARLRAVCAPLQSLRKRVPARRMARGGTEAVPVVRLVLRSLGRSDLNLLAAYRRIPILPAPPTRVHYTRARTRSVYRKKVAEIALMVERSDKPGAGADRARLAALAGVDSHLALVRDWYENVRANVWLETPDERGRSRLQVAGELPLMYTAGRSPRSPAVAFPDDNGGGVQRRQRAGRLHASRYLATLPVYRYRGEVRERRS